jgi:diguanylate cyclase (GGDEF)-like protein
VRTARFLERFSLRAVLSTGFGLVIVLGALSAASLGTAWYTVVQATDNYLGNEARVAELAVHARADFGQARRLEKDFLLYLPELGYQEARSRYATRLRSRLADIREDTQEIRRRSRQPAVAAKTVAVEQALDSFEAGFLATVDLYARLAGPRSGLGPRLHAKAAALEGELSHGASRRVFADYVAMARAESEYRDNPRQALLEGFFAEHRAFVASVAEEHEPRNTLRLAREYAALFGEYAATAEAIRDAQDRYLQVGQRVEPLLEEIVTAQSAAAEDVRAQIAQLSRFVQWLAVSIFGAALALAAFIAWWFSGAITRSTQSLIASTREVASGRLEPGPPGGGPLEFRALNESFASMTRALREARDDQRRKQDALEQANLKLNELASHDPLTGLHNRRYAFERGADLCAVAGRYGRALSVLLIDVDHFKQVNDRFGHAAGDDVLRYLAAVLPLELRATDLFARLGGEEFAVLLPETELAEALLAAERVRGRIERAAIATDHAGEPLRVTVSIGVAAFCGRGASLEQLLNEADQLLYQAKREGRNRVAGPRQSAERAVQA